MQRINEKPQKESRLIEGEKRDIYQERGKNLETDKAKVINKETKRNNRGGSKLFLPYRQTICTVKFPVAARCEASPDAADSH